MKKIEYHNLNASILPNTTGVKSGKEQIIDFIDDKNTTEERKAKYGDYHLELLDDSFDLTKFRAHVQAKPTDILSSAYLSSDGFFLSKKAINIFSKYSINNFQYLKTLIHGHQCENWSYKYLNIGTSDIINFSSSRFIIKNIINNKIIDKIIINSIEDMIKKNQEFLYSGEFELAVKPQQIILLNEYDLLRPRIGNGILISNNLKNEVEKEGLTGFEFIESDIEFYINE